jgi:hypothetical protein
LPIGEDGPQGVDAAPDENHGGGGSGSGRCRCRWSGNGL